MIVHGGCAACQIRFIAERSEVGLNRTSPRYLSLETMVDRSALIIRRPEQQGYCSPAHVTSQSSFCGQFRSQLIDGNGSMGSKIVLI